MKPSLKHAGLALLALALTLSACQNPAVDGSKATSPVVDTLPTAPVADAADNTSYNGVYKGVLGTDTTSASFWISIADASAAATSVSSRSTVMVAPVTPRATLKVLMNGTTLVSTFADLTVTSGKASGTITWSYGGKTYALTIGIASGATVTIDPLVLSIGGSVTNVVATMLKETSTAKVTSWEGTYSGTASDTGMSGTTTWTSKTAISGIWNFVRTGDTMSGTYSGKNSTVIYAAGTSTPQPDTYSSGSYTATIDAQGVMAAIAGSSMPDTCKGSFSDSSVSGTWSWATADSGSGTWSGKKTQ